VDDVDLPARGGLRLLADPTFGPFLIGKVLSAAGVWVHNIACAITVFELTGSATLVGLVSVAQFTPQVVLAPWSGARADRGDRQRELVVGRLVAAGGSLALVLAQVLVGLQGTAGALAIAAGAMVVGIGFALGGPAMQAMIPSLVRPSELATAVAMSSAPYTLARAAGPALGAALVATGGPAAAWSVAAGGNLLFAVAVACIRPDGPAVRADADRSAWAGLRLLRDDPAARLLVLSTAALGMAADPVVTLAPAIARAFGGGAPLVGLLASAFGIGALAAFGVLGPIRRQLGLPGSGSAGLACMAAGAVLVAAAPGPALAVAAMGLSGAGMTLGVTATSTALHQRVPDEVRGRVMALWSVAFLGCRPVAAAVNGLLADLAGYPVALAVVAAVAAVAARRLGRGSEIGRMV
jgi:MFS family permease